MKCEQWHSRLQSVIDADETQTSSLNDLSHLSSEKNRNRKKSAYEMLKYVKMKHLIASQIPQLNQLITCAGEFADRLSECMEIKAMYSSYSVSETWHIDLLEKQQSVLLDPEIDYFDPTLNLSNEARNALTQAKPVSIAAASRITGVDAAAMRTLFHKIISDRKRSEKRGDT